MAAKRSGYYYSLSSLEMDRILHRFRPIAPKPAASGSGSGGSCSSLESSGLYNVMPVIRKRRRSSKRGNNSIKRPAARRHRKRKPCREEKIVYGSPDLGETPGPQTLRWLCFSNRDDALHCTAGKPSMTPRVPGPAQRTSAVQDQAAPRGPVVASTVSVEWVADTWVAPDALGRTDAERKNNLERDTCPGFTSDGWGRVTWTNGAFRRMVGAAAEEDRSRLEVWLVAKEGAPEAAAAAFTCRVRVEYAGSGDGRSCSLTLPCDVWRMDGGGFAWRLDVDAALTLGLGL
ncbi:hypothetical protein ACJRO7_008354 [Eucalyptus globulus]|uniref:DUF7950 domain-containing protein n=1 Tax=Eucalyptus globulus TaxID=34317 RepID=A0ABD3IRB0_EUCGL